MVDFVSQLYYSMKQIKFRSYIQIKIVWKSLITTIIIIFVLFSFTFLKREFMEEQFLPTKFFLVLGRMNYSLNRPDDKSPVSVDDFEQELDTNDDSNSSFQAYESIEDRNKSESFSDSPWTNLSRQGLLIDTPGCKIPDFDAFHSSIKSSISKPKMIKCSSHFQDITFDFGDLLYYYPHKLPIIYHPQFIGDKNFPNFKTNLRLAKPKKVTFISTKKWQNSTITTLSTYSMKLGPPIHCCYRSIERVTQNKSSVTPSCDNKWRYGRTCLPINKEVTKVTWEGVVVTCNVTNQVVYTNVHHFVRRNKVQKKLDQIITEFSREKDKSKVHSEVDRLSVIIFGTDSVSRLNFHRQLPKTLKFIKNKLNGIEFDGFNKVGDNTYPNLVAVLSGMSSNELDKHQCITNASTKVFDECPFIWKNFTNQSYITSFIEDSPWMGLFNYVKNGFLNPPTDYYGRPYFLASEKLIGKTRKGNSNLCQGNLFSLEVLQKYSLDFSKIFLDVPTFSLVWSASLTHDFLNFASFCDDLHLNYLQKLHENGILNKTVVFFMSDHGMRWGRIRKTFIGAMEDRLPYMFVLVPDWFKTRYTEAYKNLQENSRLLISNFDVHKTLLDIANNKISEPSSTPDSKPSIGISLFKKIPRTRTCSEAGISEHYCTCQEISSVTPDNSVLRKIEQFLKNYLNVEFKFYPLCSQFNQVSVIRSNLYFWNQSDVSSHSTETYFVQARAEPGLVLIEATIKSLGSSPFFEVLGEISRINAYGKQSHCISHRVLRKYCVCKDTLIPVKLAHV